MAAVQNASFASPLADANYAQFVGNPRIDGILNTLSGLSAWTVAFTLFAIVVTYDQGTILEP
jgi:sterol 22-desaturase